MYRKIITTVVLPLLLFAACSTHTPEPVDTRFDYGYAVYYGPHYQNKGIDADVWAMEFFSSGVRYDEAAAAYSGSGRILTLTDVFAEPSADGALLPAGTYSIDTTFSAGTIIAGRRESGYDIGAYITTLVDGRATGIDYLTNGSMTVSPADSARTDIAFRFRRQGRAVDFNFSDTLWVYVY
ncbi:MAG: hypothetical protein IJ680_04560 [Paludibacteraceae bacterium]|nr:hypothetical protein [Paludibacteraceae bacterium]